MDEHDRSLDEIFGSLDGNEKAGGASRRVPFKFLDPYDVDDREIFFGREAEQREIFRKFFSERLLLIYGESGTGKTSLLRCGLLAEVPPSDLHLIHLRNSADPWGGLARALDLEDGRPAGGYLPALRQLSRRTRKPIALVFDQFEEVFILEDEADPARAVRGGGVVARIGPRSAGGRGRTRGVPGPPVGVRDPAFIALFQPGVDPANGTGAGPRSPGRSVPGMWCRGGGRAARASSRSPGGSRREIELPDLQVLMDRLYRRAVERNADHPAITVADYEDCGRLESILAEFLVDSIAAMPHPEAAKRLLKAMVTADGTKRAVSVEEAAAALEDSTGAETEPLLRSFEAARIARDRGDNRFELRHDALARTVHSWLTDSEKELIELRQLLDGRLREYERDGSLLDEGSLQRIAPHRERLLLGSEARLLVEASETSLRAKRSRRRRLITAAAAVAFLILAGFSAWSLFERRKAEVARHRAEQETRNANFGLAQALLEKARGSAEQGNWPEVLLFSAGSVLHQARAGRTLPMDVAQPGPFERWRIDTLMTTEARIQDADFDLSRGRCVIASGDNALLLVELSARANDEEAHQPSNDLHGHSIPVSGRIINRVNLEGGTALGVSFDPTGRLLAAAVLSGESTSVRLWRLPDLEPIAQFEGGDVNYIRVGFDGTGNRIAAVGNTLDENVVTVWNARLLKEEGKIIRPFGYARLFEGEWYSSRGLVPSMAMNPVHSEIALGTWDGQICITQLEGLRSGGDFGSCFEAHESGFFRWHTVGMEIASHLRVTNRDHPTE